MTKFEYWEYLKSFQLAYWSGNFVCQAPGFIPVENFLHSHTIWSLKAIFTKTSNSDPLAKIVLIVSYFNYMLCSWGMEKSSIGFSLINTSSLTPTPPPPAHRAPPNKVTNHPPNKERRSTKSAFHFNPAELKNKK